MTSSLETPTSTTVEATYENVYLSVIHSLENAFKQVLEKEKSKIHYKKRLRNKGKFQKFKKEISDLKTKNQALGNELEEKNQKIFILEQNLSASKQESQLELSLAHNIISDLDNQISMLQSKLEEQKNKLLETPILNNESQYQSNNDPLDHKMIEIFPECYQGEWMDHDRKLGYYDNQEKYIIIPRPSKRCSYHFYKLHRCSIDLLEEDWDEQHSKVRWDNQVQFINELANSKDIHNQLISFPLTDLVHITDLFHDKNVDAEIINILESIHSIAIEHARSLAQTKDDDDILFRYFAEDSYKGDAKIIYYADEFLMSSTEFSVMDHRTQTVNVIKKFLRTFYPKIDITTPSKRKQKPSNQRSLKEPLKQMNSNTPPRTRRKKKKT